MSKAQRTTDLAQAAADAVMARCRELECDAREADGYPCSKCRMQFFSIVLYICGGRTCHADLIADQLGQLDDHFRRLRQAKAERN